MRGAVTVWTRQKEPGVILVRPSRSTGASNRISKALHYFYHSYATLGDSILGFPHKLFYVLLFALSVLIPYLGLFLLGCVFCSAYRGRI